MECRSCALRMQHRSCSLFGDVSFAFSVVHFSLVFGSNASLTLVRLMHPIPSTRCRAGPRLMVATIRFIAEVANNLVPGGDGSQLSQALDIACRQGYQGRQAPTFLELSRDICVAHSHGAGRCQQLINAVHNVMFSQVVMNILMLVVHPPPYTP